MLQYDKFQCRNSSSLILNKFLFFLETFILANYKDEVNNNKN